MEFKMNYVLAKGKCILIKEVNIINKKNLGAQSLYWLVLYILVKAKL